MLVRAVTAARTSMYWRKIGMSHYTSTLQPAVTAPAAETARPRGISATLAWTCALMVLASLQGIANESWRAWSGQSAKLLFLNLEIMAQLALYAVVVTLLVVLVRLTHEPVGVCLGFDRLRARDVLLGLVCGLTSWIIVSVLASTPIIDHFSPSSTTTVEQVFSILSLWTLATVAGPVAEELLFRGFLHHGLRRQLGAIGTLLVTSIMFALIHRGYGYGWDHVIFAFVYGLMLGGLRWYTGGTTASLAAHVMVNGIPVTAGLMLAL